VCLAFGFIACGAVRTGVFHPQDATPVLWRSPNDAVGAPSRPQPPFQFVHEERHGASPKFEVTDARGMRWEVKLGVEAHTETAAARLLTAAGYFVEDVHYFDRVRIKGLPQLHRGSEFVLEDGGGGGARFEARPADVQRGKAWDWAQNPFVGTPASVS
jgi:hypothetical protein